MKIITPLILTLVLSACGEQSTEAVAAEQSIIGRYGPKDWQSGAQAEWCTSTGGEWTCTTTGGVAPLACQGRQYSAAGGVFELGLANTIVSNSYNDATYDLTGETMSWFPSGTFFKFYALPNGEFIVEDAPGCAMLYEKYH